MCFGYVKCHEAQSLFNYEYFFFNLFRFLCIDYTEVLQTQSVGRVECGLIQHQTQGGRIFNRWDSVGVLQHKKDITTEKFNYFIF